MKLAPMKPRNKHNTATRAAVLSALDRFVSAWPQAYIAETTGLCKSMTKFVVDELIRAGDVFEVWARNGDRPGGARLYALTAQGRRKLRRSGFRPGDVVSVSSGVPGLPPGTYEVVDWRPAKTSRAAIAPPRAGRSGAKT